MDTVPPQQDTGGQGSGVDDDVGEVAALLARYIGDGPNKISQREAARRTEVRQQTIWAILNGRTTLPEDPTMEKLTQGLGLDPDEVASALARDRARSFVVFQGEDKPRDAEEAAALMSDEEWREYLSSLEHLRHSLRKKRP